MKCQRNSGWAVAFASRSCARFSPSSVIPASASVAELLQRHVLDRGEDLDAVGQLAADPLEVGADAGGVEAGDQTRHTSPAWRPVTPPSRRWEKNRPNQHMVHSPTSWISETPAAAS